jgi:hypothetical protein
VENASWSANAVYAALRSELAVSFARRGASCGRTLARILAASGTAATFTALTLDVHTMIFGVIFTLMGVQTLSWRVCKSV